MERRREQLLAAGLERFGTQGWATTTVREICAEAGLSQRYFYEQFSGREACFVAVLDQVATEVESLVREAVAQPGSPQLRAERTLTGLVDYFAGDHRRLRVAFVESFATSELRARRAELLAAFAALASRLMTALLPEPATADAGALELSAVVLSGGLAELLVEAADGHLAVSTDELVAQLVGLYGQAARLAVPATSRGLARGSRA